MQEKAQDKKKRRRKREKEEKRNKKNQEKSKKPQKRKLEEKPPNQDLKLLNVGHSKQKKKRKTKDSRYPLLQTQNETQKGKKKLQKNEILSSVETTESEDFPKINPLEAYQKRKKLKELNINILELKPVNHINIFDKSIPTISERKRKKIKKISIKVYPEPSIYKHFNVDKKVSESLLIKLNQRLKVFIEKEGEQQLKKKQEELKVTFEEEGNGEESYINKPPIDNLFKSIGEKFPPTSKPQKPYLIFLPENSDDNYSRTLMIILREIYRKLTEKGKPELKKIVEEEDKYDLEAEGRIIIIEREGEKIIIRQQQGKNYNKLDEFSEKLKNNIKSKILELISQGLGFIIFHLRKPLLESIQEDIKKDSYWPKMVSLEPVFQKEELTEIQLYTEDDNEIFEKDDEIEQIKKKLASILWGYVIPKGEIRWEERKTFDNYFCVCEDKFEEELKSIYDKSRSEDNSKLKHKIVFKDEEGPLHKYIKVFIVRYLLKKESVKIEDILTENSLTDKRTTPDVRIGDAIFEIETLYGRGDPELRIKKLIESYDGVNEIKKIFIILTNLDAILWYKHLFELKKTKQLEKPDGVTINIMTLDIPKGILIPISKIGKDFLNPV
ncbi:hypothetical protein LCGC14_1171510 [marine sediment metagenome]|uniref:Uncharacterized protein n=1 Tax=marine sediment metagenome TaxID=412755 RepID=A0A0F9P7V6_9ZZZZ